jgi:hypothetical protein
MAVATKVKLPVLKLIKIEAYPMFPGLEGGGFEHAFQSGLNVIVGVNGLGKTTLLNILFRMLVGRSEPKKADKQEPGAKLHELTELKQFGFFAARIGADARAARVTLEIAFDKDIVRVARNLGPSLDVLELRHNKLILEKPTEEQFLELVRELSGIETAYDWDFVVRNLLFFFEDKVPLIWNPKGQFEILRILFLDTALSAKCAKLHDEIMAEDSRTRNLAWHIETTENSMAERLASLQATATDASSVGELEQARADIAKQIEVMESAEDKLQKEVQELEREIFNGKLRAHDEGVALERSRIEYLKSAFPNIPEVTRIVFGKLFADEHCMLCRNSSSVGQKRLKALLANEQCPACESKMLAANKVVASKSLGDARLRKLEESQRALEKSIHELDDRREAALNDLEDTQTKLNTKLTERLILSQRIDRMLALSGDSSGITEERKLLDVQKRELDTSKNKLGVKRRRYDALLEEARDSIGEVADEIVKTFGNFARSFILEECTLTYEMDARPIGQGGIRMNFPSFTLKMTSAVLQVARERHEQEEVSESQKEFIDLAFRMALLKAANRGRGSLLVIETPEASLDSVFIDRAGLMLHDFAHGRGNSKNQIIATSNLNKENMIPALLGLKDEKGGIRRATKDVQGRVLNLLQIAAPSRAYTEFKPQYDQNYKVALGL